MVVQDPPMRLESVFKNNVYHQPKDQVDRKGEIANKGTQAGGPFDNDLKRKDAGLITRDNLDSDEDPRAPPRHGKQKGGRGRQNPYFKEINEEDKHLSKAYRGDESLGSDTENSK